MATKKQKREAAQAKRAQFEAETKASGLEAQRLAKEAEDLEFAALQKRIDVINDRHRVILARSATVKE